MSNFASGYIKYINHLEQINDAAVNDPEKMITEVEESYHEGIINIARNICEHHKGIRLIMLAGPSSSGKTTTAALFREYLMGFGVNTVSVSMDDFYKGKKGTPILPDGTPDYEAVEALDVQKLKRCISDIIARRSFYVPQYHFNCENSENLAEIEHKPEDSDIVIMEGIHALNPMFTADIAETGFAKLYVSVKQMIKDANGEVLSPLDLRLVRRIVRDVQFRNTIPEKTIAMWAQVVNGENLYIRPYRMTADYTVNSIHIYEPCVLRTLAIPLLREISEVSPCYKKAREIEARLMRFEPLELSFVPKNSMLREFIGEC